MRVIVKYFAAVREIVQKREETIDVPDATTVSNLLSHLAEKYGMKLREYVFQPDGRPRATLQFLINGKNITSLQGQSTTLRQGDEFAFIPPVGGGAHGHHVYR